MASRKIDGRRFVVTGTLSGMSRTEAESALKSGGGLVSGDVGKSTHVLVVGDKPGSKVAKAEALGIELWTEAQLLAALKATGGSGSTSSTTPKHAGQKDKPAKKAAAPVVTGQGRKPVSPEPIEPTDDDLMALALSANTPAKTLVEIARDRGDDPEFAARLLLNPATPSKALAIVASYATDTSGVGVPISRDFLAAGLAANFELSEGSSVADCPYTCYVGDMRNALSLHPEVTNSLLATIVDSIEADWDERDGELLAFVVESSKASEALKTRSLWILFDMVQSGFVDSYENVSLLETLGARANKRALLRSLTEYAVEEDLGSLMLGLAQNPKTDLSLLFDQAFVGPDSDAWMYCAIGLFWSDEPEPEWLFYVLERCNVFQLFAPDEGEGDVLWNWRPDAWQQSAKLAKSPTRYLGVYRWMLEDAGSYFRPEVASSVRESLASAGVLAKAEVARLPKRWLPVDERSSQFWDEA